MSGRSAGVPYWHQPTQSSPSYTRTWWTEPRRTCSSLAARFSSASPNGSGWNPRHQQPPQTPLFASTRAAKSSQVSSASGRVVYVGSPATTAA